MGSSQKLEIGTKVLFDGEVCVVAAFIGSAVRLRTSTGGLALVALDHLVGAPDFEIMNGYVEDEPRPRFRAAELADLPKEARKEAEDRLAHLNEAVAGYPSGTPGVPENFVPKPEYDPALTSVTQRMLVKAREVGVSESTLWGMKRSYERRGLYGLVDKRRMRPLTAADRLHPRLRAAFFAVLDELTSQSNASHARIIRKVKATVAKEEGENAVALPSDRTLYRVLEQLSRGRNTFGSARSRRDVAGRPATTYRRFKASRPGEVVLIDTTALDVFAVDPLTLKWVSLELTLALDLYTRSILAWRFTPRGTKGVDAALVLRDVITPVYMRRGWPASARWPYHGVPETVLLNVFNEQNIAGVPIVHPETVVVDHGRVYESEVFEQACRLLGITIQSARPYSPTDKAQIERMFRTIRQSLLEGLPGYKGPDVWSRGERVEDRAFYFIEEIEEIFAQWVVRYWQVRPHAGLHMPGAPKHHVSPNDMYQHGLATAGFVYVPPSPDYYYELLPIEWRKIGHDGVKVKGLKYDGDAINEYRNRPSRHSGIHRGKWPMRYDPRDYSRVYFEDPDGGGWHELRWVDAPSNARPFNDTLLSHAKGLLLARRGRRSSHTSRELAKVLEEIFERTERDQVIDPKERKALGKAFMTGPQAARDRKIDNAPTDDRQAIENEYLADGDDETSSWDADPSKIEAFPVHGRATEADYAQDDPEGNKDGQEVS